VVTNFGYSDFDFSRDFMIKISNFVSLVFNVRKDIPEIIPVIGAIFSRKGINVDYRGCNNGYWNNQHISQTTINNVTFKNEEFINRVLPIGILDKFISNKGFNSISEYIKTFGNNNISFDTLYFFLKPYYFVFSFLFFFFFFFFLIFFTIFLFIYLLLIRVFYF
jgi:hypothetical protein